MIKLRNKSELIAEKLYSYITSGVYNEKLPSEQQLAREFSTTPVTAAKALNILKEDGVVTRIAGRGSFVTKDATKEIIISFGPHAICEITDEIEKTLKKLFPTQKFVFSDAQYAADAYKQGCDIICGTTLLGNEYSEFFSPMPNKVYRELSSCNGLFTQMLDIHRCNNLHYGFPMFFSPIVFAVNKDLFKQLFPGLDVYNLSIGDFFAINRKISSLDGIFMLDTSKFIGSAMMSFIYSSMLELGESVQSIEKGINQFKDCCDSRLKDQNTFNQGICLLVPICRQNLAKYNIDVNFDIVNFSGLSACAVASESLFISNQAKNQDKLFEIARSFLSPEIQHILGRYKMGIPMDCAAAMKSLDCSNYRDDIFFDSIKRCVHHQDYFDRGTLLELYNNIFLLSDKSIDLEKIEASLKSNYQIYMNRKLKQHEVKELVF
jgi:DNA-binding transcriptional regulator YhcF (GntR family)